MRKIFVSVIVPASNSEKTIEKCIHSLLNQNYPKGRYEIMIVDNGSTDDTVELVRKYGKKIILLHNPVKNSYEARNTGIMKARGSILAFTDSDCVAHPSWLRALARRFENSEVKIVGGSIAAASKKNSLQKYCDKFCHAQEIFYMKRAFATSNMGLRSSKGKILFDTGLSLGADFELCSRIVKSPREIIYEPRAMVYHQYSNSLWEFLKKHFLYGRSNGIILRKHKKRFFDLGFKWPGILKRHGPVFAILKIMQDISFGSGVIFGYIIGKA